MRHYDQIIFICRDNTCRSIMAEAIMKNVQANIPPDERSEILSRGLVVLFPEPLNPKCLEILQQNGLVPDKQASEALKSSDIHEDHLLITMTEKEKAMVEERYQPVPNLFTLWEFVGQKGDVEIPLGGTMEDYMTLYEHIDLMVRMVVQRLTLH